MKYQPGIELLAKLHTHGYSKEHMHYTDYNWQTKPAINSIKVSRKFDDTTFSIRNGNEMLYFINRCAWLWGWRHDVFAMQRLEKIIREKLPVNVTTQTETFQWIRDNYPRI